MDKSKWNYTVEWNRYRSSGIKGTAWKTILTAFVLMTMLLPMLTAAAEFTIEYKDGQVVRDYPDGSRPLIGLALSGGGARGMAHIGVIEVFNEHGIPIDRIAGTSMGSIVGGLYAAGYSTDAMKDIINDIDWSETFSNEPRRRSSYISEKTIREWPLFELRFQGLKAAIPSSLSSGQRISQLLTWLTLGPTFSCDRDFSRLPIPFRSVTTDLDTGESVVLSSGNLGQAIQASSTVPLLFSPVVIQGRSLVDGGLKDNLPVDTVRDMGGDIVVAVSIDESLHDSGDLDNPLNVADQVSSILMRNITQLSRDAADVLVVPDVEGYSSSEFSRMEGLIEMGRQSAEKAVPELQSKIDSAKANSEKMHFSELVVMPESDRNFVMDFYGSITGGRDNITASDIADLLEKLWDSGHYSRINAVTDRSGDRLTIQCQRVPERVDIRFDTFDTQRGVPAEMTFGNVIGGKLAMQDIAASIDSLMIAVKHGGFSLAEIGGGEYDNETAHMTIDVHVPKVTRITIPKNLKSRNSLVKRELLIHEGDVLDMSILLRTVENLYGTNLFQSVIVDVGRYQDGVSLAFLLDEKQYTVARFGLHYDEYYTTEGRLMLTKENILGFGGRFIVTGHTGKRRQLFTVENMLPRIYNSLYTFSAKIFSSRALRAYYFNADESYDYKDERIGTLFSLGQQMDKLGNAMLQLRSETIRTGFSPESTMKDEKKEFRSIVVRTIIDSYDRYPFPHSGFLNQIFIESSTHELLGGSEQYVKLFWNYSQVMTLAKKHTFTAALSLGTADTSTPEIEEFTLGGTPTRLNCYNPDTGASHFYADFPGLADEERRGNRLAVGRLGYRLFIPRAFYLDLTYAVGNVWPRGSVIRADTMLQAYGVMGSFVTFMGPLSFGWGITSEGNDRMYLTSGWEF